MSNQTIPGLNSITTPSSAGLLWVSDPNASPQDRSWNLANLWTWISGKVNSFMASITAPIATTSTLSVTGASTLKGAVTASQTILIVGGVDAGGTGTFIKRKVISIGTWNMNSVLTKSVAHGLTLSKIVRVSAVIMNDAQTTLYSFGTTVFQTGAVILYNGYITVDATNVNFNLPTTTVGFYAASSPGGTPNVPVYEESYFVTQSAFSSTSNSRGWIIVEYTP